MARSEWSWRTYFSGLGLEWLTTGHLRVHKNSPAFSDPVQYSMAPATTAAITPRRLWSAWELSEQTGTECYKINEFSQPFRMNWCRRVYSFIFFIETSIQQKVIEIFMSLRSYVEAPQQYLNPELSATIFNRTSKSITIVSASEWYQTGVCIILFISILKNSMKKYYSKNCWPFKLTDWVSNQQCETKSLIGQLGSQVWNFQKSSLIW